MAAVPQKSGLFPGAAAGRSDTVKATVPSGTYIIPADIVSALGDGNTAAGAKILDKKFGQDSQGGPQVSPPPAASMGKAAGIMPNFAKGGSAKTGPIGQPVPILASSGEYRVLPKAVAALGGGDIEHGHNVLDKFVGLVRKENVKKIKSLPKPKR